MLALLHLFTDGNKLMARDKVAELRKQYGILSSRVRPVVDAVSLRSCLAADLRRGSVTLRPA
jgi:hypothetical protein